RLRETPCVAAYAAPDGAVGRLLENDMMRTTIGLAAALMLAAMAAPAAAQPLSNAPEVRNNAQTDQDVSAPRRQPRAVVRRAPEAYYGYGPYGYYVPQNPNYPDNWSWYPENPGFSR